MGGKPINVQKGKQGFQRTPKTAPPIPEPAVSRATGAQRRTETPRTVRDTYTQFRERSQIDYSAWEPPDDLNGVAAGVLATISDAEGTSIRGRQRIERELARAVLPDLSTASDDDLRGVAEKLFRAGGFHGSTLGRIVETERRYRAGDYEQDESISPLKEAQGRVEDALLAQDITCSPEYLIEVRLDSVQEQLSRPYVESDDVTVKPPSGREIEVSRGDARALLLNLGVAPESPRSYEPVWPKN